MAGSYGEYKVLRKNKFCFELKNGKGEQFLVNRVYGNQRYSYYGHKDEPKFIVESKDKINEIVIIDNNLLASISSSEKSAAPECYYTGGWDSDRKSITEINAYLKEVIADIKSAKNPRYIGNYCVNILYEMAKGSKIMKNTFLREILPYLNLTTNIVREYMDHYVHEILLGKPFSSDDERKFLFALGSSSIAFYENSELSDKIKGALRSAIASMKTDIPKALLSNFPLVDEESASAAFLFTCYEGAGLYPYFFLYYAASNNKPEMIYERLMNDPSFRAEAFPRAKFVADKKHLSAIETLRYLVTHGYERKKSEIAKTLLSANREGRDYYKLRVFVSDEDTVDVYKGVKDDSFNSVKALPILMDKEEVKEKIKEGKEPYFRNETQYKLASFAYSYEDKPSYTFQDYTIREERNEIRSHLNNDWDLYECLDEALGLINYGDKAVCRYFSSEFVKGWGYDPTFALLRGHIARKAGKIGKEMYVYKEGK